MAVFGHVSEQRRSQRREGGSQAPLRSRTPWKLFYIVAFDMVSGLIFDNIRFFFRAYEVFGFYLEHNMRAHIEPLHSARLLARLVLLGLPN